MNHQPLVSVICLCHNQKEYVGDAIQSVLTQTYTNIELIVVDDASTDGSKEEIKMLLAETKIPFIDLSVNMGNCAAFNKGYHLSTGEYVIDLAADDILLPKRIEEGIYDFQNASKKSGVHFSDAFLIKASGEVIDTHYERNPDGLLKNEVPSGEIYRQLIIRYFICPPTMMMKRSVLDKLDGYDETLMYEDFDFWIRSARNYEYIFNKAPLVKKRILPNSHSKKQFAIRSKYLQSTFRVCQKIADINQSREEDKLLVQRINYEIRQCIKTLNFGLIRDYLQLKKMTQRRLSSPSSIER